MQSQFEPKMPQGQPLSQTNEIPTLLIRHAGVLYPCASPGETPLSDAWLAISGGIISGLGAEPYTGPKAANEIDARSHLVLPGFINMHHHYSQSLTRVVPAGQKGRSLDWLACMYPLWQELDPEAMDAASRLAAAQLLLSGVTTSVDHAYFYPGGQHDLLDIEIQAVRDMGLRQHALRGCAPRLEGAIEEHIAAMPGGSSISTGEEPVAILKACERALARFHDPSALSMVRVGIGPTMITYFHPQLMQRLGRLADEADCDRQIHVTPRPDDVALCAKMHGCRPTEYLRRLGWLKPKTCLVHCSMHTAEDIAVLAGTGAGMAHCPSQNMRLGVPVGPVPEMRAAGVPVAIGVDGAGSNDGGSMLTEMRLALLVHRLAGTHADYEPEKWMTPHEVLWMATREAARILGREDIGRLEPGCAADVVLIDMGQLCYAGGLHDALACVLFVGDTGQVDTTIVAGRVLVRGGRMVHADAHQLAGNANKAAAAMVRRLRARTGRDFGSHAERLVEFGMGRVGSQRGS
jgi:cytosine/adenosine deaminase-related metal-dependent hydrolase